MVQLFYKLASFDVLHIHELQNYKTSGNCITPADTFCTRLVETHYDNINILNKRKLLSSIREPLIIFFQFSFKLHFFYDSQI
jgi:hypothetical protein